MTAGVASEVPGRLDLDVLLDISGPLAAVPRFDKPERRLGRTRTVRGVPGESFRVYDSPVGLVPVMTRWRPGCVLSRAAAARSSFAAVVAGPERGPKLLRLGARPLST